MRLPTFPLYFRAGRPGVLLFAIACGTICFGALQPTKLSGDAQTPDLAPRTAAAILQMLREVHYRGDTPLSAEFAGDVQSAFLDALDDQGLILYEQDRKELLRIPLNLNALARNTADRESLRFFEESAARFRHRLVESESILETAADAQLDFESDATLILPGAKRGLLDFFGPANPDYARSKAELLARWRGRLQYRTMQSIYFGHAPSNSGQFRARLAEHSEAEREKVVSKERRRIAALLRPERGSRRLELRIADLFLNTLVARFDPHSGFFSNAQKEQFEASLSASALSFGVLLERSLSGETRVTRLVPGGPAWKAGKINAGDRVLRIRFPEQRGRNAAGPREINPADLAPGEVARVLDGDASRIVQLRIRKADGRIIDVTLYKQKLSVEDNIVSSFILEGPRRVGYIYLPAFYAEFENPGAPGCASDVAREIIKLKRENIEALILDLRNNGGGSLREAADLSGIFIDEGPLYLQRQRDGRLGVLKDLNRGAIYRGPLVVMVNGQSASAPEFFAAAMRDYRRALIVGSPTFGKATSQVILPIPPGATREPGFLKLTTNQYYDLRGESHQARGVKPDIFLPDAGAIVPGESDLPHALRNDSVSKTGLRYTPGDTRGHERVRSLAAARVNADPAFERVAELAEEIADFQAEHHGRIPLGAEPFFEQLRSFVELYENFEDARRRDSRSYTVQTHGYDRNIESIDSYLRERNAERKKQIFEDIYIDEAYRVAADAVVNFIE